MKEEKAISAENHIVHDMTISFDIKKFKKFKEVHNNGKCYEKRLCRAFCR